MEVTNIWPTWVHCLPGILDQATLQPKDGICWLAQPGHVPTAIRMRDSNNQGHEGTWQPNWSRCASPLRSFPFFFCSLLVLLFLSVKTAKTNSRDWVVIKKYLFLTVLGPGRFKIKVWGIWCLGRSHFLVAVSTSDGERVVSFFSFLLLFSR